MKHDALVIGSGIGGLCASIILARRGFSVTVLEKHERPGGKANITTVDGVEVDTGPSVLTLPEVFEQVFDFAGERLRDHIRLREPDPAFRYLYPDGTVLDVHPRLDATLASVEHTLGRAARDELTAFLAYAKRIWDVGAPPFVFGDAPDLGRVMRMGLGTLTRMKDIDPLSTMAQTIARRVKSPHLRDLLARYATYNGSNVFTAPATLHCIAHVELAMGGYGVEGGLYELVRALVRVAEGLDVRIELGRGVREITTEGKRVTGVITEDGARLGADVVIANADVQHVFGRLLPPARGEQTRSKAKTRSTSARAVSARAMSARSMSGWTGIIKMRRRPMAAHTVLFPENYEDEFHAIFDRHEAPSEPTVYLSNQAVAHGRAAWDDHDPVFVMTNAPALGDVEQEGLTERARNRLESAGLLDASDELLWTRTPRALSEAFPDTQGSIYGDASNGAWSAFSRPKNRVKQHPGLYLASGSAHPGGGLPLCALSGVAAARAALEDCGVRGDAEEIRVVA